VAVAAESLRQFGKFLYVANENSNDVSMYTIDATTGALTSTGTIAAGTSPSSVAVDPPASSPMWRISFLQQRLDVHHRRHHRGLNLHWGDRRRRVSRFRGRNPSGKFAYVANSFSFSVSMYTIDATTGFLT